MASVCESFDRTSKATREISERLRAVHLLLIIGVVLAGNLNVLSAGFVWDDNTLILSNIAIRHWHNLSTIFAQPFLSNYYRPVVTLSFALEYAIWGPDPFWFHLTNLLLHAANSILVFVILNRVLRNAQAALLGTLLFASHPVQKGAVVIADRTGMLAAFFFLGALLLYIGFRRSENYRAAWGKYVASVILGALAFFSKEEALTLPAILILADLFLFPEKVRLNRTRTALLYVPLTVMAFVYLGVRTSVLGSTSNMAEAFAIEPIRRLLTIPEIILNYIFLLVFPRKLDMNPRTPLAVPGLELSTLATMAVFLLLLAAVPWAYRRFRPVAFGLLWFFIVFLPMSNVIPIFSEVADRELFTPIHFLYLPSIGISLCAGYGLQQMLSRLKSAPSGRFYRMATIMCVLCFVLVFCLLSLKRNTTWKNEIRLFEHMVQMHPERSEFRLNLGYAYLDAGRLNEAVRQFEEGIALRPESAENHTGLGLAFLQMGLPSKAVEELRKSIRLQPDNVGSYSNLAVAYLQRGMLAEAIATNKAAVRLAPSSAAAHTNLGLIYMHAGELAEAREEFRIALHYDPDDAVTHNALGALYAQEKEYDKARFHWEEALRSQPDFQEARENLSNFDKMKH